MKIAVSLSENSVDAAIRKLNRYNDSLERKAEQLCEKLANLGYWTAFHLLAEHIYSGETISSLQVIEDAPNRYIIQAGSVALLFVEFGAGLGGGGHPLNGELNMGPGTYPGQKHAFDPKGWWYPTDDINLAIRHDKNGQGWGHSYGNPPHMPMYNTSKQIRADLLKAAQEVFQNNDRS